MLRISHGRVARIVQTLIPVFYWFVLLTPVVGLLAVVLGDGNCTIVGHAALLPVEHNHELSPFLIFEIIRYEGQLTDISPFHQCRILHEFIWTFRSRVIKIRRVVQGFRINIRVASSLMVIMHVAAGLHFVDVAILVLMDIDVKRHVIVVLIVRLTLKIGEFVCEQYIISDLESQACAYRIV